MQCVILAGGLGTRMQSVSKELPKSLLPVRHRPFLYYQLAWLAKQGIKDVVLCIGHGGDQIQRYAEDGRIWGMMIHYVNEGNQLRGTGGALRLAYEQKILEPDFFVTYGDSFLPIDFNAVSAHFRTRKEPALMVVMKNEGRWDKSNASFDGQKVTYDKKKATRDMIYIDYGLSILRASLIEKEIPPHDAYDLADLLSRLSKRGKIAGYEVQSRFYEVGSPQGLKDFDDYLSKNSL
jgi:NDP-sugar pyrophosphorylase family protein